MIAADIIAGILFGILSGMGIGGGGLLVIYLTLIRGFAQIDAQGINLLFFVFASMASMFFHARKRSIDFVLVSHLAFAGIIGSVIGSYVTVSISQNITRKLFGVMLIGSGIITASKILSSKKSCVVKKCSCIKSSKKDIRHMHKQ